MQAYVVWTEIPVTNLQTSADFCGEVFGWNMEIVAMDPNKVAMFNAVTDDVEIVVGGHLY
jgi:predicted enzyme related to lactoylglutathione lyase